MKKMHLFYVSSKHIALPIKIQHEMPYIQVSFIHLTNFLEYWKGPCCTLLLIKFICVEFFDKKFECREYW